MQSAIDFWDREIVAPTHVSWLEDEQVRRYVNRSISGDENTGATGWFRQKYARRFERALSIGCGAGGLERDLVAHDVCDRVDAFDGSISSLATAVHDASSAGMSQRIRYFAADFNRPAFPRDTYDLVIVHQALHHVAELELLYAEILRALKRDGLLYFDEYVGPSRFDWTDRNFESHRALYDALPAEVRKQPLLLMPIQPDDPSEGYRSSDIVPALTIGFYIVDRRDYGGNVLSVLYPEIDWSAAPPSLTADLIRIERDLLSSGHDSFYSVVVARPKQGAEREAALRRYAIEARTARVSMRVRAIGRAAIHFKRRVGRFVKKRLRRMRGS